MHNSLSLLPEPLKPRVANVMLSYMTSMAVLWGISMPHKVCLIRLRILQHLGRFVFGLQGRLIDAASIEDCPGQERQESRPHIAILRIVDVLTCLEGKCNSLLSAC